ncbi:hypothetical protein B0I37DRAFT_415703 [Chaetomium sp. MPI-CAGE-AT-0009]|nr:hypothetical protein B0I37DRAFT_415703 [Chaetomium sp. MPI-CAGE-AT-0009]
MAPALSGRVRELVKHIKTIQAGGHLAPSTAILLETLLKKAGEPTPDMDLLKEVVSQVQDSQKKKRLSDRVAFLLKIGDWASHLIAELRKAEERMPDSTPDLCVIYSINAEKSCHMLNGEIDQIQRWRKRGSPGDKPASPALDRLGSLCKKVGVDRDLSIQLLNLNLERNSNAHHPPPKLNGNSNLEAFKNTCKEYKDELTQLQKEGSLDQDELEIFKKTVDQFLLLTIEEDRKKAREKAGKPCSPHSVRFSPETVGK